MTASDSSTPKMGRNQEKAVAALLSEKTIAAAAGISKATLLRWLKEEGFAAAYRAARRDVVTHAVSRLQQASSQAVDTLLAVASDVVAPASSRVAAARCILDASLRAVELDDLGARVEEMEARLATLYEPQEKEA